MTRLLRLLCFCRYLTTSRELKRLDSLAFSPIYSHFAATSQVGGVRGCLLCLLRFGAQLSALQLKQRRLGDAHR